MKKKLSVILCAALVLSALCAALLTACNDKPNEPAVYTLDPDRDFGLYWYNDEGEIMLSVADMPVEFYDPKKPTVVYSHGWKKNPVPEALVTQQSTVESTTASAASAITPRNSEPRATTSATSTGTSMPPT